MKKKILLLLLLLFLLNLFWEVSHSLLYDWSPSLKEYIPLILAHSFMDAVYISIILGLVTLKNSGLKWINKPRTSDYSIIILLTLGLAIFIELKAFYFGKWAYNSLMPTVFGIGLSPLIQLAVTSLLALRLVKE